LTGFQGGSAELPPFIVTATILAAVAALRHNGMVKQSGQGR
jgi:hypothetical protein